MNLFDYVFVDSGNCTKFYSSARPGEKKPIPPDWPEKNKVYLGELQKRG